MKTTNVNRKFRCPQCRSRRTTYLSENVDGMTFICQVCKKEFIVEVIATASSSTPRTSYDVLFSDGETTLTIKSAVARDSACALAANRSTDIASMGRGRVVKTYNNKAGERHYVVLTKGGNHVASVKVVTHIPQPRYKSAMEEQ